ncbi:MAG: DUF4956 domain-containing protein [Kiritimatiellae bacterium]|nr:DUF4956 domain-containing protein [Kiritimatiellia bacterium]
MNHTSILDAVQAYEDTAEFLSLGAFATALAVSLAAALFTAALYRLFCESRGTGSQVYRAFPALSLAITTLFLCIQISIPLSLGLLGSLSIIRFRTPVKEPEEVGSIMLVIASSIAAATFHFAFIAVMLAFAAACAVAADRLRLGGLFRKDGMITVSMEDPLAGGMDALESVLAQNMDRHHVLSSSSQGGRTTLQISFRGLKCDPCKLSAAIRAAIPGTDSVNAFLDRPGGFR